MPIIQTQNEGDFTPRGLFLISKTSDLLCKWVRASVTYMSNCNNNVQYEFLNDTFWHAFSPAWTFTAIFSLDWKQREGFRIVIKAINKYHNPSGSFRIRFYGEYVYGRGVVEGTERKKREWEEKRREGTEKKRFQALRKGSISSTAQGRDLSPVIEMAKSLQICHTDSQRSAGDSNKASGGGQYKWYLQ